MLVIDDMGEGTPQISGLSVFACFEEQTTLTTNTPTSTTTVVTTTAVTPTGIMTTTVKTTTSTTGGIIN